MAAPATTSCSAARAPTTSIGGAGTDWLKGDAGNDEISGGAGTDGIRGDAGDDFLDGGAGSDDVRGGDGDDIVNGGAGRDRLAGGSGRDVFAFDAARAGQRLTASSTSIRSTTCSGWTDPYSPGCFGRPAVRRDFVVGKHAIDDSDRIVYDKASATCCSMPTGRAERRPSSSPPSTPGTLLTADDFACSSAFAQ